MTGTINTGTRSPYSPPHRHISFLVPAALRTASGRYLLLRISFVLIIRINDWFGYLNASFRETWLHVMVINYRHACVSPKAFSPPSLPHPSPACTHTQTDINVCHTPGRVDVMLMQVKHFYRGIPCSHTHYTVHTWNHIHVVPV